MKYQNKSGPVYGQIMEHFVRGLNHEYKYFSDDELVKSKDPYKYDFRTTSEDKYEVKYSSECHVKSFVVELYEKAFDFKKKWVKKCIKSNVIYINGNFFLLCIYRGKSITSLCDSGEQNAPPYETLTSQGLLLTKEYISRYKDEFVLVKITDENREKVFEKMDFDAVWWDVCHHISPPVGIDEIKRYFEKMKNKTLLGDGSLEGVVEQLKRKIK